MTQQLTPNYQLPYYQGLDLADGPTQQQALAQKLDTVLRTSVSVATAAPILDVGVAGQIRAGRQLTVADFTMLGLTQPIGLWNLSNLSNLGSDGRALSERRGGSSGAVPIVGYPGINGVASTATMFPTVVSAALV